MSLELNVQYLGNQNDIVQYTVKAAYSHKTTATAVSMLFLMLGAVVWWGSCLLYKCWFWLGVAIPIVLLLLQRQQVLEERMLVIEDVGVQLTCRYRSGSERTHFIDVEMIDSIIINEGISMCQIIFYMAIVVKHQSKLALCFPHLTPRFEMLHQIYTGVRKVMYKEGQKSAMGVPEHSSAMKAMKGNLPALRKSYSQSNMLNWRLKLKNL